MSEEIPQCAVPMAPEIEMIRPMEHSMDVVYYKSLQVVINTYKKYIVYHTLKAIALTIFCAVYFSQPVEKTLMVAFILADVTAFLYILMYIYLIWQMRQPASNLTIAVILNHAKFESRLLRNDAKLQEYVGPTYDNTGFMVEQMPQQTKQRHYSILAVSIRSLHFQSLSLSRRIIHILNILSLALIFYFIISLSTLPQATPTVKAMGSLFIIFESFAKIEYLLGMILCALSPLILLICCFLCCCVKPSAQRKLVRMEPIKYHPSLNLQCQHDCSICFQSFKPEEEILILPCDNKHVFHKFCAESWFNVSMTCPMCRKDLSEEAGEEHQERHQDGLPRAQNRQGIQILLDI